jgi:rubredoxin
MQRIELTHRVPDCTGHWVDGLRLWGRRWRCSGCGAVYADSPSVLAAVTAEHLRAHMLCTLADEGRVLLRRLPEVEPER